MNRVRQSTFATAGFERHQKITKRAAFLAEMDQLVPWQRLCTIVEKHYPRGEGGRPTIGLERMLRMYFLQLWFNLSDPAVEEALYDIGSMRVFVGVDLGRERVPDETTVCKFRHLLEKHRLGERIFKAINAHLAGLGMKIGTGTIVDATIIHAPSSTKNAAKERDPEMHSTKKGNQWYFGMKLHIGVDSKQTLVHSVAGTAANVHDSQKLSELLHGRETRVWGDSAYRGQREVIRKRAPRAQDFTNERAHRHHQLTDKQRQTNRTKSRVRAVVEHPFGVVKRLWGFTKVRYRGVAKNLHRAQVMFGLSNLYLSRNKLLRLRQA
ncbi:MAG: IS5 family transposase [Candidatus Binataceae bacterium]